MPASPRRTPHRPLAGWWRVPGIGHSYRSNAELGVEIVEIAEAAGEEEVLADIAIGSFDLALRLGAVGTTSAAMAP